MENGVFVHKSGKEVMERGLPLPTPRSKEEAPKGNPLRQDRDLSQWHQEVGHLAMVFSPVLLFGFARTTKALRSDCLTRGRGAKCFQLPLSVPTERDKNNKLS